jgi:hypothetical protein
MFVYSLRALRLIAVAFAETVDLVECCRAASGVDRSFVVAENRPDMNGPGRPLKAPAT